MRSDLIAKINPEALRHNYRALRAAAPAAKLCAPLKADFDGFQDSIRPLQVATNVLSKFVVSKDKDMISTGIETALSFVLRNVVLSRAGWLTKMVVPYVAKKYAVNKLADNKADLVHMMRERGTYLVPTSYLIDWI